MANLLKDLWNKATEAIEEHKRERKLKQLQLQGELDIVKSSKDLSEKEDALQNIIMAQKDAEKPSFQAIVDADRELKIAQKEHQMAVDAFKEFFGEEPKYV